MYRATARTIAARLQSIVRCCCMQAASSQLRIAAGRKGSSAAAAVAAAQTLLRAPAAPGRSWPAQHLRSSVCLYASKAAGRKGSGDGSAPQESAAETAAKARQQARLEQARRLMAEAAAGRTSSSGDDDDAPPAAPAPEDPDYSKALSRAMRLINFRERAAGELVKRLLEDGYSLQVAGRVVARMQELGLQDDGRFAQMYTRWRWRSSVRAPYQIGRELKMKGVGEQHIKEALELFFGPGGRVRPDSGRWSSRGGDDDDEEEEEDDPRDRAWEQLVEQARRRVDLSQSEDVMKRRAKLARWLQYRGHDWDTVKRIMKEVGL